MMALVPLLGTAIENASEMHSVINVRLGLATAINQSVQLTKNGVIEN
jgi:hypothetical protein